MDKSCTRNLAHFPEYASMGMGGIFFLGSTDGKTGGWRLLLAFIIGGNETLPLRHSRAKYDVRHLSLIELSDGIRRKKGYIALKFYDLYLYISLGYH